MRDNLCSIQVKPVTYFNHPTIWISHSSCVGTFCQQWASILLYVCGLTTSGGTLVTRLWMAFPRMHKEERTNTTPSTTQALQTETDREQMLGGCFRKLQKLQKVWSLSWGSYVKLNQSNNSKTRFLKQHNHSVWQMSEDCLQSIWGTVCYQNKQFADFRKGILGWHFDICLLKKISGIMRRMFVCVGGGGWAAYAHSLALAAME